MRYKMPGIHGMVWRKERQVWVSGAWQITGGDQELERRRRKFNFCKSTHPTPLVLAFPISPTSVSLVGIHPLEVDMKATEMVAMVFWKTTFSLLVLKLRD